MKSRSLIFAAAGLCCALASPKPTLAATPVATYQFNDTLAASEAGKPALTAVDPLGLNTFENATVYGSTRRVYHWDGNATPASQQAGLSLDTTGLVPNNSYSVEMLFEFQERDGAWRRILDVQNRTTDNGFYVDADNHLDVVFPGGAGSGTWTNNVFHHVVLTDGAANVVNGYLDGVLDFTFNTSVMHINNPDDLLNFFLDNSSGAGQDEFSDGRVALIRLYDQQLSNNEVAELARNPFPVGTPVVPEPASLALLATGALPLLRRLRRGNAIA